jgi:hypothetical protein
VTIGEADIEKASTVVRINERGPGVSPGHAGKSKWLGERETPL